MINTNTTPQEKQLPDYRYLQATTTNIPKVFARHETFHPRYGWLKKGFEQVRQDENLFYKDTAPIVLGVGKNMVKSIRYWCHAFKLIDEVRAKGQRIPFFRPTEFGNKLLGSNGWDPYLEDPASLWLLHWNLMRNSCYATAWYFTFNIFHQHIFTSEDLFAALRGFVEQTFSKSVVMDSSLTKDLNCILRMYVAPTNSKQFREDSLDCPFVDLGLITNNGNDKYYSFNLGSKNSLPPELIVAACLDYISELGDDARTIAMSRLCYDVGSPGSVFKLSEDALYHAIETVASKETAIALSDTAGLVQLSFSKEPKQLSDDLLNRYYKKRTT